MHGTILSILEDDGGTDRDIVDCLREAISCAERYASVLLFIPMRCLSIQYSLSRLLSRPQYVSAIGMLDNDK